VKNGRRFFKMAVLVSVFSLFLAGCGGESKTTAGGEKQSGPKYPAKPIEFIVPWGPGGGADQTARSSAPHVEKALGVSLPVVNVAGATGVTGLNKLLAAANDGHSILVYTGDTHALLATSKDKPPFKLEDLTPIARMIKAPSFLFVKADGKYKNWADFEKAAKANPGKVKVGITGQGSPDDMTVQFLNSKGISLQGVPFPNPSERYVSVIGGHVDALYEQAGDVRQYVEGKQMIPIIVFDEKRFDAFKDVPCSKELKLEIYLPQTRSIMIKGGTDPAKIKVLADAFKKAYDTPEYQKWLEQQYGTKDSYQGPEDTLKSMKKDIEDMKALIK